MVTLLPGSYLRVIYGVVNVTLLLLFILYAKLFIFFPFAGVSASTINLVAFKWVITTFLLKTIPVTVLQVLVTVPWLMLPRQP